MKTLLAIGIATLFFTLLMRKRRQRQDNNNEKRHVLENNTKELQDNDNENKVLENYFPKELVQIIIEYTKLFDFYIVPVKLTENYMIIQKENHYLNHQIILKNYGVWPFKFGIVISDEVKQMDSFGFQMDGTSTPYPQNPSFDIGLFMLPNGETKNIDPNLFSFWTLTSSVRHDFKCCWWFYDDRVTPYQPRKDDLFFKPTDIFEFRLFHHTNIVQLWKNNTLISSNYVENLDMYRFLIRLNHNTHMIVF